jgi:hypothetical protein
MLNKKISLNPKVAQLINELGGLAGVIYTWTISHLDCEGRAHGSPPVLKATVCPMLKDVTDEYVEKTLIMAHDLGLIRRYTIDDEVFLSYPSFGRNQTGLRKDREQPSELPGPENGTAESGSIKSEKVAYFVRGTTTGLIKIGQSSKPIERFAQLKKGASEEMELLAVGGEEKDYHKEFAEFRVHGEWFSPAEEILAVIDRHRSGAGPELVRTPPAEVKRREVKRREENNTLSPSPKKREADLCVSVIKHYQKIHPRSFPKIGSKLKEWRMIKDRLNENWTVDDLCMAIDGMHHDPWEGRRNHLELKYAIKEPAAVAKFIEIEERHRSGQSMAGMSSKEQRGVIATQLWIEKKKGEQTCKNVTPTPSED